MCLTCGRMLDWPVRHGAFEDHFCSGQCEQEYDDRGYDSDDEPTPYRNGPGRDI